MDDTPIPLEAPTPDEDSDLLVEYPYVDGPLKVDYGFNVRWDSLSPNHSTCR